MSDVQLEQMVGNLLDNAQKYANPGATVKLWCALSDGWATLYVSDDGPGIAPEHHARLFERFYRIDRGRSRDAGGCATWLEVR